MTMSVQPWPSESPADSDANLVRAVIDHGSERAFRDLYRRHTARMYRIAMRLVQSEMDAEDVVQEAWLRAGKQLGAFGGRSQLSTWLCGFAVNVAREVLTRRGRWAADELADMHLPSAFIERSAERLDIERAVASLPVGCRAAFLLHDVEGFTHEEIAEQLGWSAGTSKTQVFRARRALRRVLGEEREEEAQIAHDTRTRKR
jgi:RNA polymerase sigma-70 factor, ECF subfamily